MSPDEQGYAEKRDFIRMFIDAPVDFTLTGTDNWFQGTGKDLSGGGLSFVTDHELSEGDRVDIKLHPITAVTPPLEAIVTVIRIDKTTDGQFAVSTRIENIVN